jgi:hypothetical protein
MARQYAMEFGLLVPPVQGLDEGMYQMTSDLHLSAVRDLVVRVAGSSSDVRQPDLDHGGIKGLWRGLVACLEPGRIV